MGRKKASHRYTSEAMKTKYFDWRKQVLERDDFKCQQPGCYCNGRSKVEAHHIRTWAKSKRDRFDVNNGIALCKRAHKAITGKEELFEQLYDLIVIMNKSCKTNTKSRT